MREAFSGLTDMRRSEGERLYVDIVHRLSKVEQIIQQMAERAPLVVDHYRTRLFERIQEWQGDLPLDESRLALEVALFADKANIDEELTRATSHIAEFRKICATEERRRSQAGLPPARVAARGEHHRFQGPRRTAGRLGRRKQGGNRKDSRAGPKHRMILRVASWISGPGQGGEDDGTAQIDAR